MKILTFFGEAIIAGIGLFIIVGVFVGLYWIVDSIHELIRRRKIDRNARKCRH